MTSKKFTELNTDEAVEAAPKAKADSWPKYMKSTTKFQYTDPESQIRFSPVVPVRIEAAPQEGSWLDCQMQAGYIAEA
jgi:hypothetical protein